MMKNKSLTVFLIVFLSILALAITCLMISMLRGNVKLFNFKNFNKTSNELVLDEIYNIDFNKVYIKATAGDVYIKESSNDEVRVVIYGDKENTTVETENDELSIQVKSKSCIGFCFNTTISKVEVYLPKTYENLIEIVNEYGDIKVDEFSNAIIDIEEDCGDVSILSASVIHVKNEYGDIEIGSVYNQLDLMNDCGDIEIDDITLTEDSVITDSFGDIKIGNTNEIYIDAKTELGDVEINHNVKKSDITLKIENDCGDIEIKN